MSAFQKLYNDRAVYSTNGALNIVFVYVLVSAICCLSSAGYHSFFCSPGFLYMLMGFFSCFYGRYLGWDGWDGRIRCLLVLFPGQR